MNMKRFLILLLALTLVLSFASCKNDKDKGNENVCEGHVDADDDYLCDKCGANYDDGDEAPDVVLPTEYEITFVVKLDNGEVVSGVKFTITRGAKSFDLVSDSSGKAVQKLEAGPYAISYDYETLPEYCTPDTFGFRVEEGTSEVILIVSDNTPDGSVAKPFPIQEKETEITLEPGQEINFVYRGATTKKLTINADGISVIYDGNTYNSEDGSVSLDFYPEIGKETRFSVKNNNDEAVTTVMSLIAPLGSNENPIILTENQGSALVSDEETVYYKWIASADGVIVLTSESAVNNISLTKVLENDVLIISQTVGNAAAYLTVKSGDEITIGVSAINATERVDVDFAITTYAGTDADPVPVLMDEINISLFPEETVVFSGTVGKTLKVSDENRISIWHDTITHGNEDGSEIVLELLKPIFVLNNYSEYVNGITITFE